MAGLLLKNIYKVYENATKKKGEIVKPAVSDFNMEIEDKEFIVFVGPSGCGKSTTLRMIAGLEEITSGELYIDGKLVNDVEPKERDIAMVFQNYALYPHMTVYDNMAFALKLRRIPTTVEVKDKQGNVIGHRTVMKRMPKEEIKEKVLAAARILDIEQYLERKPKALSGGQRQRVALGRTIVREPKVFLLDEPLSNLDAKLRASMRTEISKLHTRLATTFLYVTHDQVEAMTMGTRIVVMKDGFMQQVDTPQNLYDYPVNLFVAGFIGTPQMNFFRNSTLTKEKSKVYVNFIGNNKIALPKAVAARIKNVDEYLDTGKPVTLGVRPEDIHQDQVFISSSPDTVVSARIEVIEKLGAETQIYCELDHEGKEASIIDNSTQMIAKISSRAVIAINDVIELAFDAKHLHLFDGETEASILERDENYEVIEENAEGSAFVPPTPQEMRDQIAAARSVTKEMKAQMKKDAKMAKLAERRAAKAALAKEAEEVEVAAEEAPVEEAAAEEKNDQE